MNNETRSQQPSPAKPLIPQVQLSAEDHQRMAGMSELQRKMYIMRKNVKVYREGALFNRRKLKNPDPNKEYVWVNVKEERRLAFEAFDWKVCTDPNVGSNYWKPEEKCHKCADLILYEIPKELYDMLQADAVMTGLERTDSRAAESAFAAALTQVGVQAPVFQPKI